MPKGSHQRKAQNLRCVGVSALALLFGIVASAQTPDKRYVIILMGPTGSGKSTQTEILKKSLGIPSIAVDDLIRENPSVIATAKTARSASAVPQANPALDTLVDAALGKLDLTKGVVLDGYPASREQADHLAQLVRTNALPSPVVIQLDVSDDIIRERLKKRARPDDTPELISQRLKQYHRELDMVRSYYPQANIWTIDASKPPKEVADTIRAILNDELPKQATPQSHDQ